MDSTTVEALSVEGHRRAQIAEAENAKLKALCRYWQRQSDSDRKGCRSGLNKERHTKNKERHTEITERLFEALKEIRWYEIHCPPGYALSDSEIEVDSEDSDCDSEDMVAPIWK